MNSPIRENAHLVGGNPVSLVGLELSVGEKAPDFVTYCFSADEGGLIPVTLADTPAQVRLFSVVLSLDTPICAEQTRRFNQALAPYGNAVASYTVSVDLPFAQDRFAATEEAGKMRMLSDYMERSFGMRWGVLIEDVKLLARSIFILDASGTVTYREVAEDSFHHPDYDEALMKLRETLRAA